MGGIAQRLVRAGVVNHVQAPGYLHHGVVGGVQGGQGVGEGRLVRFQGGNGVEPPIAHLHGGSCGGFDLAHGGFPGGQREPGIGISGRLLEGHERVG